MRRAIPGQGISPARAPGERQPAPISFQRTSTSSVLRLCLVLVLTENEPESHRLKIGGCMGSPCRGCSGWLLVLDWAEEHLLLIQRGGILMPVRSRSADDPPRRTPSFVCEVPLRASRTQERTLLARLEAAPQVYNAGLGQARRRVRPVRAPR